MPVFANPQESNTFEDMLRPGLEQLLAHRKFTESPPPYMSAIGETASLSVQVTYELLARMPQDDVSNVIAGIAQGVAVILATYADVDQGLQEFGAMVIAHLDQIENGVPDPGTPQGNA